MQVTPDLPETSTALNHDAYLTDIHRSRTINNMPKRLSSIATTQFSEADTRFAGRYFAHYYFFYAFIFAGGIGI